MRSVVVSWHVVCSSGNVALKPPLYHRSHQTCLPHDKGKKRILMYLTLFCRAASARQVCCPAYMASGSDSSDGGPRERPSRFSRYCSIPFTKIKSHDQHQCLNTSYTSVHDSAWSGGTIGFFPSVSLASARNPFQLQVSLSFSIKKRLEQHKMDKAKIMEALFIEVSYQTAYLTKRRISVKYVYFRKSCPSPKDFYFLHWVQET